LSRRADLDRFIGFGRVGHHVGIGGDFGAEVGVGIGQRLSLGEF